MRSAVGMLVRAVKVNLTPESCFLRNILSAHDWTDQGKGKYNTKGPAGLRGDHCT